MRLSALNSEFVTKCELLSETNVSLRAELNSAQAEASATFEVTSQKLSETKTALEAERDQVSTLKIRLDDLLISHERAYSSQSIELSHSKLEVENLSNELLLRTTTMEAIESELQQNKQLLEVAEHNLKDRIQAHEVEQAQLSSQVAVLQSECASLMASIESERDKTSRELKELLQQTEQVNDDMIRMRASLEQAESSRLSTIDQYEKEINSIQQSHKLALDQIHMNHVNDISERDTKYTTALAALTHEQECAEIRQKALATELESKYTLSHAHDTEVIKSLEEKIASLQVCFLYI
jgi:hypothetical protein